jgi:alpha-beta hydrolase superfamily lysophospholipase
MEFTIKLKEGQVLRGLINSPGERCRAIIIFVHGLGEHLQRYNEWSGRFVSEGIGFTGVDLPGHGRSEGKRGYIKSYSSTDEMIGILMESVTKTFPGIPVFLYGHSLGGGIVLDYILRKKPAITGAIVTSPWLRLTFQPGRFRIALASVLKSIMPGLIQPSGLVTDHISHDKAVVEKYKTDPLVHGKISVSLFHSAVGAANYSLAHASELKIPLLLIHGSDDLICSPDGSREFASNAPGTLLKIWDGGYHELHNESFKNEVFALIMSWLNSKIV